tara:strand:+ start:450 stop:746 length:297 start_codon:yes stop_codon:yes gene_type:complete
MAVDYLHEAGFKISIDTMYNWTHSGKIKFSGEKGRWYVDQAGLIQILKRLEHKQKRAHILEALISQGRTSPTAIKFLQRQLRAGETLQAIARKAAVPF